RKTCGALYLDNQAMNGVVAAATPASPQTPRREVAAGARRMPWITASPSRQATAAAIAAITSAGMPASTAGAGAALGAGAAGLAGAGAAALGALAAACWAFTFSSVFFSKKAISS